MNIQHASDTFDDERTCSDLGIPGRKQVAQDPERDRMVKWMLQGTCRFEGELDIVDATGARI